MEFHIEAGSSEDVLSLRIFKERVGRATYSSLVSAADMDLWVERKCTLIRFEPGLRSGGRLLVARSGETVVGMCMLRREGQRANLTDLYAEVQGEGIGGALERQSRTQAQAWGIGKIEAAPYDINTRALRFFEAGGYVQVGALASGTLAGACGVYMTRPTANLWDTVLAHS